MRRPRAVGAGALVAILTIALGACGAATTPEPVSQSPVSPSSASPPPSAGVLLPGEPWIVSEWGVPEADSVGIVVVRPDGTDEHWATPGAPIASGDNGGDGWQLHPDWSPDGQQLAFVVDVWPYEAGHRDIWVSDADGGSSRRVYDCVFPCDVAEFPAWSPDGRSVLFVRWDHVDRVTDGSALELVDVATGEVTTIAKTAGAENFAYPRWSSDGRRIAVQIETWTDITEDSELVSTSVAIVDLRASPATITKVTRPTEWANYPDWHPTRDLIVFSRRPVGQLDGDHSDLYTMRPDGSEVTLLVEDELDAVQPTWMPDGSGVTFVLVSGDDYSTASMWTVDADGSNVRPFPDGPRGGSHPRLRPIR